MSRDEQDRKTQDGARWAAHPVLAALVTLLMYAVPLGVSLLAVLAVARINPVSSHRWLSYALLGGTALGVSMLLERALRRLVPIATLLRLTMLFPDRAPSRFKVARTAASSTRLQRLDGTGSASDAAESALALMAALGTHDRRTRGHSERVRVFSDMLAEQLKLDQGDRDRLRWASLLHDIGKLHIPVRVLTKPDRLDRGEFEMMKTHPEAGAELTASLLPWLGDWGRGIVEHHEKYDGSGYPRGFAQHDISPAGRIIGLVDAFETMTAARSYKKAMATRAARAELARCAGTHFDPLYVRAFLGVSLPRLIWAMGPLTFLLQLPFLRVVAQAGTRTVVAGDVAATVAGAAVIAGAGITNAYGGVPAPVPPAHATTASHVTTRPPAQVTVGPVARPVRPVGPVDPAPALPAAPAPMLTAPDAPVQGPVAQPEQPVQGPVAQPEPPVQGPVMRPEPPVQGPVVPTPTPTTVDTPSPTPIPVDTPSPTPTPVDTPSPTPTPVDTPSPTPTPVDTPTPTLPTTPASTPTPTPLPAAVPTVRLTSAPSGTVTRHDVSLSFASDDPVATFECRLDGGAWVGCGTPTGYTVANGAHTVDVRAIGAGGTSLPVTASFTVAVAPSVTITSGPAAGSTVTSNEIVLALSSDDPAATFECSTDGTAYAPCTSTPRFALRNGPAQVWARAAGASGISTPATTGAFTIAAPLPLITLANVPTATYDTAVFDVATSDPAAALTCQLDGDPAGTCGASQTYAGLALGPHTVTVVASNSLTGSTTRTFTFTTYAEPLTTITSAGVAGSTASVSFTGTDATSFECSLDGGAWAACTSPASFLNLAPATHVVAVRGIGPAGPGAAVQTGPMTTGTVTTYTAAPTGTVIRATQTFAINQVPGASGYQCRVDSDPVMACTNPVDLPLPLGQHTVQMWAVVAGVAQTPASTTFTVAPDTVTLTSQPTTPTKAKTASFSFSGASGLTFQCSLGTSGWTTCTSPTVYSNLAPGTRTFRVRTVDSSGAFGNALTYTWQVT